VFCGAGLKLSKLGHLTPDLTKVLTLANHCIKDAGNFFPKDGLV
jgi:hypothetical protein